MATAPPVPDQSQQAPPQSAPASAPPAGGPDVRVILEQFRNLAMDTQQLASRFPEFQDAAAQILPLIQKGMTQVAGNAQRTPPTAPPPA